MQEAMKMLKVCSFIHKEQHPDWLANILLVMKKNTKFRVCIDFNNLKDAYPKDNFALPIIDLKINNTCGFERMSFKDDCSVHCKGYTAAQ